MKLDSFIRVATETLINVGVPTARLDVLVLLEDVTARDRGWLLAHPEFEIDDVLTRKLDTQIKRRTAHEPLSYIRGKCEFYGREFMVTPDTLQPRTETEAMIDLLKKLDLKSPVIADIGTGSGCLAITAQLELANATMYATDISPKALEVAKRNSELLGAKVTFMEGDLLEPLLHSSPRPTVLLCNLPYIPTDYEINQAATHEPKIALFAGADGLDLYRELLAQISQNATMLQFILTEALPFQHEALLNLMREHSYTQIDTNDLVQVFEHSH